MSERSRPPAFEVLLRAVATAGSDRELADTRALAAPHRAELREKLEAAIAQRRRALGGGSGE